MRIAVDVMGGDHGCGVVVAGVKQALQAFPNITELHLVGDQAEITSALSHSQCHDSRLQVHHASEVLTMQDKPAVAVRRKKDSSIVRAMELVKEGKADAVISPGNTGGILAAALFGLGRLPGIDRPGIATVIPAQENDFILLDAGANIDCKPIHLLHYAVMGSIYAREILRCEKPRVGILSVGTEDTKGNELSLEAFRLCQQIDLNFIGNVEGYDLFKNRVDVVVCDGFVGNIVLKTIEGIAKGMMSWLKLELTRNPKRQLGALLAKSAFLTIKRRMDPDACGGAPLLGLNGNVMKAHGSAKERAIMNAIRVTTETIQHNVNQVIVRQAALANDRLAQTRSTPVPAGPVLA
jgi:glycerol-3-phosphate acyltransferase PlsX